MSIAEAFPFGSLRSSQAIALKAVKVAGSVAGLLFSFAITQEYQNDTEQNLEVIYTFPLGYNTTLLGLKARISDRELIGEVVKKQQAEEKYEKAITDGDAAILLQKSIQGLYTASLGNIKAGERVSITIHCAQLLQFAKGRIRLVLPTTVSQKYGDPYVAGLASHEELTATADASYQFELELLLKGDVARGQITCPSHEAEIAETSEGLAVSLPATARLDRDFVLLMAGLDRQSHAMLGQNDETFVMAASFLPNIPQPELSPLALKILVDCSGSMSGSRINHALRGLEQLLDELQPADCVSYSCFGSCVRHLAETMQPCTAATLRQLSRAIESTKANMGGTETAKALQAAISGIEPTPGQQAVPTILLVTDGDVWDVDGILATAKAAGHRIFCIGIGCASSEYLLRNLANGTGGACELVTENEDIAQAIVRMFQRMRGAIAKNVRIVWPENPIWATPAPQFLFDGETVHCYAEFAAKPESGPTLSYAASGQEQSASISQPELAANPDLVRLVKMEQLALTPEREQKLAIALKYQLVSDFTSLILVHERAEKLKDPPKIQHIPKMPACGHGCNGIPHALGLCCFCGSPPIDYGALNAFCRQHSEPGSKFAEFAKALGNIFMQRKPGRSQKKIALLTRLAQNWLRQDAEFQGSTLPLRDYFKGGVILPGQITRWLKALAQKLNLDPVTIWAAFIHWAIAETQEQTSPRQLRSLAYQLKNLTEQEKTVLHEAFADWLAG